MKIDVHNMAGEVVGQTELDDSVWGIEPNIGGDASGAPAAAGECQSSARTTPRRAARCAAVAASPGARRARVARARARPARRNWVGGGVVWGPHPRKYTQQMPQKMRRLAVRSALSAKVRDERVTLIQAI